MNALYVTVCIPFLLVLAGFNHAHGFTTFGKTPTNQQTPQPPTPHVSAKSCGDHTDCNYMPHTSCVAEPRTPSRKSCLCGDNKPPANGVCHADRKGPSHRCTDSKECVDDAMCVPMSPGTGLQNQTVCKCVEGFVPNDAECSGADRMGLNAAMGILAVAALYRTLY
ncbi:hypothetical protein ILUMI_06327 [Ignelater luminosus]|uniref:Uncharacterized protein n=1 Tax=Ignelater luminosus TaxID=2038154 RepID=A0A8K0DBB0_IGNLU|nr:hypothetical protein ILUMI_06327 [Ignelater luminosus]